MPASEFFGWQAYFDIYPFTQDRQDWHAAMISITIANYLGMLLAQNAGKTSYNPVNIETFLPDYLGAHKPVVMADKSIEQQAREFADFKQRLNDAQPKIQ